jgi:hypothetical protein
MTGRITDQNNLMAYCVQPVLFHRQVIAGVMGYISCPYYFNAKVRDGLRQASYSYNLMKQRRERNGNLFDRTTLSGHDLPVAVGSNFFSNTYGNVTVDNGRSAKFSRLSGIPTGWGSTGLSGVGTMDGMAMVHDAITWRSTGLACFMDARMGGFGELSRLPIQSSLCSMDTVDIMVGSSTHVQ